MLISRYSVNLFLTFFSYSIWVLFFVHVVKRVNFHKIFLSYLRTWCLIFLLYNWELLLSLHWFGLFLYFFGANIRLELFVEIFPCIFKCLYVDLTDLFRNIFERGKSRLYLLLVMGGLFSQFTKMIIIPINFFLVELMDLYELFFSLFIAIFHPVWLHFCQTSMLRWFKPFSPQ